MRIRLLTAAGLLPVVALIYFGPAWLFLGLGAAAGVAVTLEALRLFQVRGHQVQVLPPLVGVLLVNLSFHFPSHLPLGLALSVGACLVVGARLLRREGGSDGALESVAAGLTCLFLPGLLLAFQVALRGVGAERPALEGLETGVLLFLYAAVFGNDAAAYFGGRAFGRAKLIPGVSPGKTVEGFIAGLAGGVLLGVAFSAWVGTGWSPEVAAGRAFLICLAAVLGDLAVSLLKRGAQVKDTGGLLPGHGGLLDRLDGLLFASPLLYFMLTGGKA